MKWEISILQFLEIIRSERLSSFFQLITITGESVFLLVIIATVYWCFNKKVGLKLGFVMLFSAVSNGVLKNIVKAPRPFELGVVGPLRKHTATGYSFPSGHTQGVTTFWVALMVYIKEKWVYYVGVGMILLVALSRLYLGVHWPIDVMTAILMGVVFMAIGEFLFKRIENISVLNLLFICILIGSTLALNFDSDYTKSIGTLVGIIIGMILERRYVSFSTKGSFKLQVSKVAAGFGSLMLVAGGLKLLLPGLVVYDFIRYILMAMWIIAGAPYMFKMLGLCKRVVE